MGITQALPGGAFPPPPHRSTSTSASTSTSHIPSFLAPLFCRVLVGACNPMAWPFHREKDLLRLKTKIVKNASAAAKAQDGTELSAKLGARLERRTTKVRDLLAAV